MNPRIFVSALSEIELDDVFNPYRHRCPVHDLADAPRLRRRNLRRYLQTIEQLGTDTIWMGRDLGYRGGRRTGLALTDEHHLPQLGLAYPGANPCKATKGPAIAERTAAEIWSVLVQLKRPPLLWNVFPFHPHEPGVELTNRRFLAQELAVVTDINRQLAAWLGIKRIICIGKDAATYALSFGVDVQSVRHPSYGGVKEFRDGMGKIYSKDLCRLYAQPQLF
ncbi:uracil-DNA glycosylase [Cupriavidus basilensis]|uniref:uracil-DNA glycosylase n=1 Tax=Cupriavidus basilensis TaxID=68895 RepID=UPI0023E87CFE|nr:uracil-DNA glycosylase [Cupriavidus basilensis]MDF3883644.1 uracil-DNA glycosylase [Cupriavidus basilensis]